MVRFPIQISVTYKIGLYRRVYDAFETYFKTYQSKSKGKFSRYDLEQFEHAHKNILTIRRLTATEIPDVMREIFDVKQILHRLCEGKSGCDVDYINYMIEETAKNEQRNQYIQQRAECEKQLEIMRSNVLVNVDENAVSEIQERIQDLQEKRNQCDEDINRITTELEQVDRKRLMISGIQRVDINALQNRRLQLTKSVNEMMGAQQTYTELYAEYQSLSTSSQQLDADLIGWKRQLINIQRQRLKSISSNPLMRDIKSLPKQLPLQKVCQ